MNQKLVFGKAGIKATTPKWIKRIYQFVGLAGILWTIVSGTYTEIPEHLQYQILKGITCGTGVLYAIGQCFGYVEPETSEQ